MTRLKNEEFTSAAISGQTAYGGCEPQSFNKSPWTTRNADRIIDQSISRDACAAEI
jgi:hypothetical protein